MPKHKKRQDPLADLLTAASPEVLADLIVRVAPYGRMCVGSAWNI